MDDIYSVFNSTMQRLMLHCSNPRLLVAVSGGSDSVALLRLLHQWGGEYGGQVQAATVEHGLRPESAAEAEQVGRWCADLGVEHHILRPPVPLKPPGLPAKARAMRYQLLLEHANTHGALHLLVAHHAGDVEEGIVINLHRGAGLRGLASMEEESYSHGIRLLRPLLHVSKQQLQAYLHMQGQDWLEDASNSAPTQYRNRVRMALEDMPQGRLANSAHLLRMEANWQQQQLLQWLVEHMSVAQGISMPHAALSVQPLLMQHHILQWCYQMLGVAVPRASKMVNLQAAITREHPSTYHLAGVDWQCGNAMITAVRFSA